MDANQESSIRVSTAHKEMGSAVMQGKKQLLASLLTYSRIANLFSKYPLHNKLLILNYHRVKDDGHDFATPFDDGVYSTDAQCFTDQMLWLKEHATLLGQQQLLAIVRGESTLKSSKPCVMVTFDDGYRDNYTVAYPILKTLDIPAVFFLTTGMLSNRELPWWDVITFLFKRTAVKDFLYNGRKFDIGDSMEGALKYFLDLKKTSPAAATRYLIMELSELLEADLPDQDAQSAEIMTWEQVREMRAGGMEFGSHTHTHRVLTTLEPMEIREELLLSKLLMEQGLGEEVLSISYPVGETKLVPDGIGEVCRECGYRIGYTTNSGVNSWDSLQTFSIKRTAYLLENVSTVSLMTLFPEIFLWDSKKTRKLEPEKKTFADVHYQQGLLHLGHAQKKEAIACFEKALRINPNYLDARIKLGVCLLSEAAADAALEHLHILLEQYAHFPDVLYYTAIAHACREEFHETRRYLEKAVAANPRYADALYRLLLVYCYFGEQEKMKEVVNNLAEVKHYDDYFARVFELADDSKSRHTFDSRMPLKFLCPEDTSKAVMEMQLVNLYKDIAVNPNMKELTFLVPTLAENGQALQVFMQLYEEYAARYHSFPDAHYALGEVYRMVGELPKAEDCYAKALELNKDYVRARVQLFKLYKQQEKWPEALDQGKLLAEYNLPYPDVCTDMAEVCFALDKRDAAVHWADKALHIRPGFAAARRFLDTMQA